MNRYSLLFAAIMAATFVGPTPHGGDTPSGARPAAKVAAEHAKPKPTKPKYSPKKYGLDPDSDIDDFLNKRVAAKPDVPKPDVIFATVPHPIETHLAADFDANVSALEDGVQDSGYLFDTAWIPWEYSRPYERLKDDRTEKDTVQYEDEFPGILLFRKQVQEKSEDPYANGLIVFLIAEKPAAGIEVHQIDQALQILTDHHIQLKSPIRIAGPNYSGSLDSLGSVLTKLQALYLLKKQKGDGDARFLVRGAVADGDASQQQIQKIAKTMPKVLIDFGSTSSDYQRSKDMAMSGLKVMGMENEGIAFLSEDESLYGLQNEEKCQLHSKDCGSSWQIPFPRDISSLRSNYEKQGIFENVSPAQPWKHFLAIKSDEASEGDTARTFGGDSTMANQESVLFGISDFLKKHNVRAVVITATNPEDAYFLSEFFHANNGGLRIVTIGGTRLFLRGSTAQFRGDLMVDDFPMMPRQHDWTGGSPGTDTGPGGKDIGSFAEHIFPTGYAQGAYISVRDLLTLPQQDGKYPWVSEYSLPNLGTDAKGHPLAPPVYLTSLGSDAPWPVALDEKEPDLAKGNQNPAFTSQNAQNSGQNWRVQLPFTLFARYPADKQPTQPTNNLLTGRSWKILYSFLTLLVLCYCVCFLWAEPVTRRLCASFEPEKQWRYWLFTVILPGILAGIAFQVLAAPLLTSEANCPDICRWWVIAELSSVLAPLVIAASALFKALNSTDPDWHLWKGFALTTVPIMICVAFLVGKLGPLPANAGKLGPMLASWREMHWESGLSLIPTWILMLLGFFLWARQASHATARFSLFPALPTFSKDKRISQLAGEEIQNSALPIPTGAGARWLWVALGTGLALMILIVLRMPSFRAITSLESAPTTHLLLWVAILLTALMLLDLLQFAFLWSGLRGLLRALDAHMFKRSFVPIDDFKWPGMWSFGGVSLYDQRAILSAEIDCAVKLEKAPFAEGIATQVRERITDLETIRNRYRSEPLPAHPMAQYTADLGKLFADVVQIANVIAEKIESDGYQKPQEFSRGKEALLRTLGCQCKESCSRFHEEDEEVERIEDWQKDGENLLCLLYIGFIQTVIARLHGLMLSIAAIFSLMSVAFAVYPFAPTSPFLLCGVSLLAVIAYAFYVVFSQMDTDPILSRITNSDDRKLEWNFYGKFAESLALPVLTLVSSLLPGGVGRVLDVARTLLSHSQ